MSGMSGLEEEQPASNSAARGGQYEEQSCGSAWFVLLT